MKILADAHIPYLKGAIEHFGEVEYLPGNRFTKETVKDKDVLIVRTVTHFGEEILAGSSVKLICSATIGYDHIDTHYCDTHGIAWRTAPGCNAGSVEQYVTASLLILAEKKGFDLRKKTIGIVGVGNVGSKVESACKKLGMQVLLNDPPREEREGNADNMFVDLETIKNESDIITLHTPLTKTGKHKTWHLVDEDFFNELDKKPILINSCRGSVTDTQAWKKAIKKGLVSGSVIDCWENEPHIDTELLEMADIATPHVAGYSADGKWTATKMTLENLCDFFHFDIDPVKLMPPVPPPPNPIIDLKGVSPEKQTLCAVLHTYDPLKETKELKKSPDKFYYFRSHYPLRREYNAYTVINADPTIADLLKQMGFTV
jgi:erythronate-4-phosphate dehydrogenase